MSEYIHKFNTTSDFESAYGGSSYKEPWISLTISNNQINYNKLKYVDLGLPSGILWATCNLGASSPEQRGDYYAWGEITPNKDTAYTWNNYTFGTNSNLTKYNTTDNKLVLEPEDDAGHVVLGGQWHIPTKAQLEELITNTSRSWTTDYDGTEVAGAIFTSNVNGNTIFFPASGDVWDGAIEGQGEWFNLWSSSRVSAYDSNAWSLFCSSSAGYMTGSRRYFGYSVRCVLGELSEE